MVTAERGKRERTNAVRLKKYDLKPVSKFSAAVNPDVTFDVLPKAFFDALGYELRYMVHVSQATRYYAMSREKYMAWMKCTVFDLPLPVQRTARHLPLTELSFRHHRRHALN